MTESGRSDGPRVAVLNVVGLCNRLLGQDTPRIMAFAEKTTGKPRLIKHISSSCASFAASARVLIGMSLASLPLYFTPVSASTSFEPLKYSTRCHVARN